MREESQTETPPFWGGGALKTRPIIIWTTGASATSLRTPAPPPVSPLPLRRGGGTWLRSRSAPGSSGSSANTRAPGSSPAAPTVDGQNPALVGGWLCSLLKGLHPSQAVQDFVHSQNGFQGRSMAFLRRIGSIRGEQGFPFRDHFSNGAPKLFGVPQRGHMDQWYQNPSCVSLPKKGKTSCPI